MVEEGFQLKIGTPQYIMDKDTFPSEYEGELRRPLINLDG